MARIGIDARLTFYTQGGIAQYTQHLIRELAALETPHEFVILQSRKDSRNLAAGHNQSRASCWTPAHHRFERAALAVEVLPQKLDLLHSPDFIPPYGVHRAIITIPDLAFLHYPEYLTAESRRYYNGQIKAAVKRAEHIIAISDATRQDVINLLDISPEKVTTIWLAANKSFRPVEEEIVDEVKARYSLPEEYILFVSTIEPRKNVNGLLKAYAALRDMLPDAPPLVLAGKRGWLYDETLALYENLGLGEHVIWLDTFSYDDLPAIYSGAQVFCLPSFYEGFGLTPLEAMACGTPVIVSDRASLPEVVGDAGLSIDPESPEAITDALRRVLTDSALATELRQHGLERAKLFSWQTMARETLAVYDQILEV